MLGAREACGGGWSHIEQQIVALEVAVDTNPCLAFDLAKTIFESACKAVLVERHCTYDDRWDLPRILKETIDQIRLVPRKVADGEGISDNLRKTVGGLQTAVQGICELRNTHGFASHGKGPSFRQLEPAHALLIARATDAIVSFLFWEYRRYSDSTPHVPLAYEDNAKFNEYVDENNDIVCIFDLRYRPSEVLFRMDSQAYEELLMQFREQSQTDMTEGPAVDKGEPSA
jgi:hypothetical protein